MNIIFLLLLSQLLFNVGQTMALSRGVNGGLSCAVCTVLSGVMFQVAEIHEENFFNITKRLCNSLPHLVQQPCIEIIKTIEPYFQNVSEKLSPDLFCLAYGTCMLDENDNFCHLFPLEFQKRQLIRQFSKKTENFQKIDFCKLPIINDICKILTNSYRNLQPAEDLDNDGFSYLETARGYDWKGRDCFDDNDNVYPGRKPLKQDKYLDTNCNGIYGTTNNTLQPWEKVLCSQSKARGLIFIGDSIGAHFHMPEVWINPLTFDWPSLNASTILLNEIDWPQFGFVNGFKNITPNILISNSSIDSLYLKLRARNRCNHRDYQNLSQNGASSFEGVYHSKSVTRNQTIDKPAIVIYAMQGNDVCNNFNETVGNMTKPDVFRKNVLDSLNILNNKLPLNSHVILMGLVNADFIYTAMAGKIHPIGQLHKNVYYRDLYEWFNCLQMGPCAGWQHSNETLRKITTQKANELTMILKNIAKNETFNYIKLHFIENPINIIIKRKTIYVENFLETVDSLHPNQNAQSLLADTIWNSLVDLPEEVLGPENKYNQLIDQIFGNQGGH